VPLRNEKRDRDQARAAPDMISSRGLRGFADFVF
jgi:hypothetical protein